MLFSLLFVFFIDACSHAQPELRARQKSLGACSSGGRKFKATRKEGKRDMLEHPILFVLHFPSPFPDAQGQVCKNLRDQDRKIFGSRAV
jgi:hypothetical protein